MRIVVTGSEGFIGKNLISLLNKTNHEIFKFARPKKRSIEEASDPKLFSLDLTDNILVRYFLNQINPDCIIHLAGNPNVNGKITDLITNNITTTFNLLDNCKDECRFIYASSATVYGPYNSTLFNSTLQKTKIIKGGSIESDRLNPSSIYAATKMAGEAYIDMFNKDGLVNGVSLRFSANCGTNSTHGVVKAIIEKVESNSEYLELFGDFPGSQKPITFVLDTATAIISCIESTYCGTLNISVEDNIYIKDIANIIMNELGINKPIKWLGKDSLWKGDDQKVLLNCEKAKKEIGWEPRFKTSKDAIIQTCINHLNKKMADLLDGQYE